MAGTFPVESGGDPFSHSSNRYLIRNAKKDKAPAFSGTGYPRPIYSDNL